MGAPYPPRWQRTSQDEGEPGHGGTRRQRLISRYEVFGPFELPSVDLTADAPPDHGGFWKDVESRKSGLAAAYGCFVLSLRNRGELPWYVGRADRKPFSAVCLDQEHLAAYGEILARVPHTAAYLHLVCRITPSGRFSRPTLFTRREIAFIEGLVSNIALARNPRLRVDEQPLLAHSLSIPGLLSTQNMRLTLDERALRAVLGL